VGAQSEPVRPPTARQIKLAPEVERLQLWHVAQSCSQRLGALCAWFGAPGTRRSERMQSRGQDTRNTRDGTVRNLRGGRRQGRAAADGYTYAPPAHTPRAARNPCHCETYKRLSVCNCGTCSSAAVSALAPSTPMLLYLRISVCSCGTWGSAAANALAPSALRRLFLAASTRGPAEHEGLNGSMCRGGAAGRQKRAAMAAMPTRRALTASHTSIASRAQPRGHTQRPARTPS
jgi:hypothetical protein